MDKGLILASSSPRRHSLMKLMGIPFSVVSPEGVDETLENKDIEQEILDLALRKAESVYRKRPSSTVIGADTIVYLEGEILGKPASKEIAYYYLKRLSGNTHSVITGVAIICESSRTAFFEKTLVTFREIPEEFILKYIETGIPMDKAGAYGIQDYGALFVKEIRGDYYNVMGFPVGRIWELLRNGGECVEWKQ